MPNNLESASTGAPAAPDGSDPGSESAPDEPDQSAGLSPATCAPPPPSAASDRQRRGFFARLFPDTPVYRFFGYVRPHLRLVAGGSVMGILKFVLPLAFPLAFKYVFDVLLIPQPRLEAVNALIDRWCLALAHALGLAPTASGKLAALSSALAALFLV